MQFVLIVLVIISSYLIGSIPFGLIIVKLSTGKDIRNLESGRTGGTNAMRAAGLWAGLLTGTFDIIKTAVTVWIAKALFPELYWMHVIPPICAIIGHNASIFLAEKTDNGRIRLRGGAGGAPTMGGAVGLWFPSLFIIIPIIFLIWLGIGFASLASLSTGIIITIIYATRAWLHLSPWEYIFYGILAEIILIWALRPNIKRLLNGTERVVGWRARKSKKE
jgi:glycerol-3-phosphate acyltransferase PlsY